MFMIEFFSNIFGYALNFIYEITKNYGLAIILFSIVLKLILLPISIKQQKTMKKTAKIQEKMKEIQNKYKNNPEKVNQEVMELYKKENMSPFSGCFSAIIQIVLLLSMFYLVRSPLTYMKKIDTTEISNYTNEIKQEYGDNTVSVSYPEISVIRNVQNKELTDSKFYINMNFLGLDLSNVPKENWQNISVLIIPILYVISSILSVKLTTNINKKKNSKDVIEVNKVEESDSTDKKEEVDMSAQMSKNMMWLMPIMSISISLIAPLGLALYWLVNNLLMIIERVVLNKVLDAKEENDDA